jgi:LacI family transcriptional regulator
LAGRKPVGLRQVASVAGVSTATVSRVINQPETVSAELRTRIEMVIKALGWVPSGTARALATRRTNTIGAVFPALALGDFARALDAMQDELSARNYTLLLARSRYDAQQEHRQIVKLVERGVDGLILVGKTRPPALDEFLAQQKVPHVNTFVYGNDTPAPCIGPDNEAALVRMTAYLLGLGHRRFGMIAQSTVNNDRAAARRDGVVAELARQGIAILPAHLVEGHWGVEEGRQLIRKLVAVPPRPTAVICGNSLLAVGALLEAQAMGIRVPEEMSIVGYDDIELMSHLPVPITTVRVPGEEIGRDAARWLLARVGNKEPDVRFEYEAEIVIRASSGPPPRA